jgi:hypothetical protein
MKISPLLFTLACCCLLIGCAKKVRSISQSGYTDSYSYAGPNSRELDEFDVLGLDRDKPVTEEDIQRATRQSRPVHLAPGSTILLIQSGAIYPDGPMIAELSKSLRVVPFTGVAVAKPTEPDATLRNQTVRNAAIITDPDKPVTIVPMTTASYPAYRTESPKPDGGDYSRRLRLAAAQAGASTIVCYWGILESGTDQIATRTISWLPVMNYFVPDERQYMRIRLKVAVIEVASGDWSVFSVEPPANTRWSARKHREATDQKQVERLKLKAYESGAKELIQRYSTVAMK